MLLAKIVGTVVATRKDPRLEASKLMLARRSDRKIEAILFRGTWRRCRETNIAAGALPAWPAG